jgi:hypothetical protein
MTVWQCVDNLKRPVETMFGYGGTSDGKNGICSSPAAMFAEVTAQKHRPAKETDVMLELQSYAHTH